MSVVNTYRWQPSVIDDLYVDEFDYHGLLYWYNAAKKQHDEIKKP